MAILLVDDSAVQSRVLARILKTEGFNEIVSASSAEEAYQRLREPTPPIDLILMDLNMPGVSGIDACRAIKAEAVWHDIPVIMVTSSDDQDDLRAAFAAGAMDYMIKPPSEVELLARVRSALKLKQEMDARKEREKELLELNSIQQTILADLKEEKNRSERLLLNVLPSPIAQRLKQGEIVIADSFPDVTVLFADIVDFTRLSARMSPEDLVMLLNDVFSVFDRLAEKHGLEKVKTIGDAYMAVAGLPHPRSDHARAAADMALEICRNFGQVATATGKLLQIRVGLHTGPVVAGVIGKNRFIYDLWGSTVNIASRMESQGAIGQVQVSPTTEVHLRGHYHLEARDTVQIKGAGEMTTEWLREGAK